MDEVQIITALLVEYQKTVLIKMIRESLGSSDACL